MAGMGAARAALRRSGSGVGGEPAGDAEEPIAATGGGGR